MGSCLIPLNVCFQNIIFFYNICFLIIRDIEVQMSVLASVPKGNGSTKKETDEVYFLNLRKSFLDQ